jgi:hypothetical protein
MKICGLRPQLLSLLVLAPCNAFAADCASIDENNEYESLERGEIVYRDLAATLRLRIKSINAAGEEICGSTENGDACFDGDDLFSAEALAACSAERNEALGTGVIFIYGEPEDEPGEGDETD